MASVFASNIADGESIVIDKIDSILSPGHVGSGSPLSVHVILDKECKYTDTDWSLRSGFSFGGTKIKTKKHMGLLTIQHISVNNNLILSVFFGCPTVLSYEIIGFSMMMSMAIVIQTFLRLVICIKRTLKPKSKNWPLTVNIWLSYLGHIETNSLNTIMISKIWYGL